jgi:CRISPR/Cas system-associated endonuclease Cas1
MRFAGPGVPAEFGCRQGILGELGAQFTARGAVHAMQAMLNYGIGILAAGMTRVVIAMGLDPCFGFLHNGEARTVKFGLGLR